ncbi:MULTISPECIES: nitroreductase [unclassified Streptomyces]|uniref:nitroreductase n=1 Tax=unclassified Streptomyces TaxID=2593676 RepID=UPI0023666538|nr:MULTISPECIES: nitroreductase [unclassified Streptomyces]MDF3146520.1 nitroreductase [Streptomyces sp. T21Q-yed]WDF36063.1 nitroreductase [Streptomyces sp. T12]
MHPTTTQRGIGSDQHEALRRILADRWTCRQFLPDAVPRDTIEHLLQLAQRTPSWCNTQPWHVHLTEGAATEQLRTELLAHVRTSLPAPDFPFPAQYTGVYRERRRECGLQMYGSLGIAKGDQERTVNQLMRNFELFDAPHVAIITTEADLGVYGAVDCGLYINTFLLAAHSLGLAAAPQAALASYSDFLHDHFGIPDNRRVVAGISFGHPDPDHPVNSFRTTREQPGNAVTWYTGGATKPATQP